MRTVLFDVDCQKGFTPLCQDELPVPGGHEIVKALNEQYFYLVNKGDKVFRVGSKDAHPRGAVWESNAAHPAFSPVVGEENADIYWPAHCVIGTKGCELLDGLPAPENYDFFVWKGMEKHLHPYGACYHDLKETLSTGILEFLIKSRVHRVIVAGLATDYCVKTTALQLVNNLMGVEIVVNLEACRGVAPDTTAKAIVEMKDAGIRVIDRIEDIGN